MPNIPIRHITSSQAEPALLDSFSVRDLAPLLQGKDMVQELHRHDYYHVLVLKKGAGHHEIDFRPYMVCDNAVFFMRPGQVHHLHLKSGSTGYLLQFSPAFYDTRKESSMHYLRQVPRQVYCLPSASLAQRLHGLLDTMLREYAEKPKGYMDLIRAAMTMFFIELARNTAEGEEVRGAEELYAREKLEALQQLLDEHVTSHRQVGEYAELLHLSVYQLNSITRKILNKTCSALISERLILEARRLLLATSSQVSQVAYELGYDDVSYFIRFFKKHTGLTPEAFRQRFQKDPHYLLREDIK